MMECDSVKNHSSCVRLRHMSKQQSGHLRRAAAQGAGEPLGADFSIAAVRGKST